uniref:Uncharacterized protein n=1 Tax=Bionectria ochroleuca TaxID=29856 RepID=A0A8H7KDN7_BIOOC
MFGSCSQRSFPGSCLYRDTRYFYASLQRYPSPLVWVTGNSVPPGQRESKDNSTSVSRDAGLALPAGFWNGLPSRVSQRSSQPRIKVALSLVPQGTPPAFKDDPSTVPHRMGITTSRSSLHSVPRAS